VAAATVSTLTNTVYEWNSHTILNKATVTASNYTPTQADIDSLDMDDVIATLELAAGHNPNSAFAASPYQYMAADIDQDGSISAFDALDIMKMAAGISDAPAQKWVLVDETFDFGWNDTDYDNIDNGSIDWTAIDGSVGDTNAATENLVAVLQGDVNGSWVAPGTPAPSFVPNNHFSKLDTDNVAALEQFFLTI